MAAEETDPLSSLAEIEAVLNTPTDLDEDALVIGGFAIDDDDDGDLGDLAGLDDDEDGVAVSLSEGKEKVEVPATSGVTVEKADSGTPSVTPSASASSMSGANGVSSNGTASSVKPASNDTKPEDKASSVSTSATAAAAPSGKQRILTPLDPGFDDGGAFKPKPTGPSPTTSEDTSSTASTPFLARGFESLRATASAGGAGLFARATAAASSLQQTIQQQQQQGIPSPPVSGINGGTNSNAPSPTRSSHQNANPAGANPTIVTPPPSAPTAAATMATNDPQTQSKFIRSALGDLHPGEKVIMFLSKVTHVADSASTVSGVASSSASRVDLPSGSGSSNATWWCCVMTFYRVVLLNYTEEFMISLSPEASATDTTKPSASSETVPKTKNSKRSTGMDTAVDRAGLSRQWQHAHAVSPATKDARGYRQHVLQMPLGAVDRVEKGSDAAGTMSSAASSVVGAAMGGLGSASAAAGGGVGGASGGASGVNGGSGPGGGGGYNLTLVLYGKDGRWLRFTTQSLGDCIRAHEALSTYAFPGRRNLGYLFAFESCREEIMAGGARMDNRRFRPEKEYARLGLDVSPILKGGGMAATQQTPQRPWAVTVINSTYNVIPSYPSAVVVPFQAAEEVSGATGARLFKQTAAFRSEGRMAALSWCSTRDAASIWRSSQPRVGIGSNRSSADEHYLQCIAEAARPFRNVNCVVMPPSYARLLSGAPDGETSDSLSFLQMVDLHGGGGGGSGPQGPLSGSKGAASNTGSNGGGTPPLKIMDLRPKSSAMANRTQGYGYESSSNYPHCKLSFYNIGNIHVVRDSFSKLSALAQSPVTNDLQWTQLVESTGWLSHIRLILNASWYAAATVHFHRLPILVHCSHGWDRTSQVSALAQLFLDPYYRTMEGFAVLVEKDFNSFGYPFHTRGGHGESRGGSDSNGSQRAPIFVQFLDCVWQLVHLFPTFFEFNGRYLMCIAEHVYSCRFGTLLCDNERERETAGIYTRTRSLWDYLDEQKGAFVSSSYITGVSNVFLPPLPTILRRVSLWMDLHLMHSPKACLPCVPRPLLNHVCDGDTVDGNAEVKLPSSSGESSSSVSTADGPSPSSLSMLPHELQILHCGVDEYDAALNQARGDAIRWRRKATEQEEEIARLKKSLEEAKGETKV